MKKIKAYYLLLLTALLLGGCSTTKITREKIEWSDFWWENEPDMTRPRVLFIGNSISRGYFKAVSTLISEKVNCDRYSTSRSVEDPSFFAETKIAMAKYNHAVIHFNNGLHGWHLNNSQYEKGLEKYVKFLKAKKSKGCKLVFSLTTPVPSKEAGVKLDPERNQVVIDRNNIARKIMEKNNVQVIDLYGLMEPELEKYSGSKGDVHYNQEGNKRMSQQISKTILELLGAFALCITV